MAEPIRPFVIDEQPGTKAYCACGKSANLPYCDGSHAGSEFRPYIVKLDKPTTVAICKCRQSKNRPYCDGTHSRL